MKVKVNTKEFKKLIEQVNKGLSTRNQVADFKSFYVSVQEGRISLRATNGDLTVMGGIDAIVFDEGDFVIKADLLGTFINNTLEDETTLESDGTLIKIQSGKARSRFLTGDATTYPKEPDSKFIEEVGFLTYEDLSYIVNKVAFSTDRFGAQPVQYSAIQFNFLSEEGCLNVVGTNISRLARYRVSGLKYHENILIPYPVVTNLLSFFRKTSDKVKFSVRYILRTDEKGTVIGKESSGVVFEYGQGGIKIYSSILMNVAAYPNFMNVIPTSTLCEYRINISDFISQLKLTTIIADKVNIPRVRITYNEDINSLHLFSKVSEIGEYESDIEVDAVNDFKQHINMLLPSQFLIEYLSKISSEDYVIMRLIPHPRRSDISMISFQEENSENYIYIVVPLSEA